MKMLSNGDQSEIRLQLTKHRASDGKMQMVYAACLIACFVPGLNIIGAIGLAIFGGEIGQHLLKTGYYYGLLDSKDSSSNGWAQIIR